MGKIASIEYFRVPPRWLFVKITDDLGNTGWGEASLEGHTQAVEGCLDAYIAQYTGMEADEIEKIWQKSWRMGFYRGGPVFMSALAGLDIALWDLKARKLGLPIYQLLGGKVRDMIKVYAWIGGDRPSDVESQALSRKSQGFTCVKMNGTEDLGWLDSPSALDACVERVKIVKATGMDAGVDFHGRVHRPMAKQLAALLAPCRPLFIEEPLLSEHIEGIKAFSQSTTTPVALGERLHSRWDVKPYLEAACVDILQPDISHVGGISELRRIAAMAEAYDVAIAPHCPLGPIALAANIQVDAATPNFVIQEMSLGIHYNTGGHDLLTYIKNPEVWAVKDGYVPLMTGPGLGIDIDEEKIRSLSQGAEPWLPLPKSFSVKKNGGLRPIDSSVTANTSFARLVGIAMDNRRRTSLANHDPSLRPRDSVCNHSHEHDQSDPEDSDTHPSKQRKPPHSEDSVLGQISLFPLFSTATRAEHMPSPISIGNRTLAPPVDERGVSTAQSSRNSPEPAQIDRQGHYVGPASGASFLLRIQRKLQRQSLVSSDASIFTFGDLPLPESDPRFLILPPRSEAESLLCRYFEFASATHRFLHRPTVEMWLQELYETNGSMRDQAVARSKTALLFMVLACAENYPKSKAGTVDPTSSARFFYAAEDQLAAEKGIIRLTSVQARLAQCIYLLSHSRLNHCWSLFGTTAHLMLALGIHRKYRVDSSSNPDYIDLECRKRTFWCAYNLDTYLSAALGRPRTFHDDDIDQSVMSGPVAHMRLSRIVANVLRDLYNIRPPSTDSQLKLAARYSKDIDTWRSGLTYLLDTDGVDPGLFQPIFLRQRNVLNMACWHAQILVHRPFLLNNFASLANLGSTRNKKTKMDRNKNSKLTDEHVQRCLEAAMNIVGLVDNLNVNGQLYNTFWFTNYFAFCAIVMLYVWSIQQRNSPLDTYLPIFRAATKCQHQTTSIATPGSLAQRYGVVLQELRLELLRLNSHLLNLVVGQKNGNGASDLLLEADESILGQFESADLLALGANNLGFATGTEAPNAGGQLGIGQEDSHGFPDASPGSSIVQMTGWGQFDSLVTGGVGMDAFLAEGAMEGWDLSLTEGFGQ
ncbi:uncharacterized protein J7T54_007198 [Emericellopsis cladophorae]|uniref:Transcription factor domain-containing protein n=1 Tax=Emericellopsis cladophorae TaxID=2686198 RepID=A0A9P9XUQ3_9HYPO|nr:uncharacterized protein J7T54_007198 [Emericellopsis cladophorae]KAI6778152.1 hypothetical protein J7T54_007198 [Emericellopsis cladophorae]